MGQTCEQKLIDNSILKLFEIIWMAILFVYFQALISLAILQCKIGNIYGKICTSN
jgi:hypothetical protein